ncbi:transcriptional regulator family: Fungal Specific TF [Penicillium frequentans]|nr:transcriptional regulator family: Fungal Specific TF [Penicillium glabrum]
MEFETDLKHIASSNRLAFLENRLTELESLRPLAPATSSAVSTPKVTVPITTHNGSFGETSVSGSDNNATFSKLERCGTAYHNIEQDEIEFQGHSSDRTFIQDLKAKVDDWPGCDITRHQLPPNISSPGFFELNSQLSDEVSLPNKELARKLVDTALDAQILSHVIHRPSFDVSFNLIYALEKLEYGRREVMFLPLLYAVIAYGCLFIEPDRGDERIENMASQGSKYFSKSRQLQNVANCQDLISLQAVFFLNLFLLTTNRTSTCYTYLSTSLSIALRMGLHRSLKANQDLISQEISKRIFWALWQLVNDVASCCGLPRLLNDDEIDQELPREVNDVFISKGEISMQPKDEICYISGANASYRLHIIQDKVTRHIYPFRSVNTVPLDDLMAYGANIEIIREIEEELIEWAKIIPCGSQYMLCASYAHVHLYLYRSSLRHAVKTPELKSTPGMKLSSHATRCIQSAQNIILLFEDMCRRGLLKGGNWSAVRMLCSSITTLLYITLASQGSYEPKSLFKRLASGRKILNHLAKQSLPASRCRVLLANMISTLPGGFQRIRDRLLNFDSEVPDVLFNEGIEPQLDNSYTASLAESIFAVRPNSHPRSSSYLPSIVGTMKGLDGSAHVLGLSSDEQQNLHQGKMPCAKVKQTADWAAIQGKTRIADSDILGPQRRQSTNPCVDNRAQIGMEGIQSSYIPNETVEEHTDKVWETQPSGFLQDISTGSSSGLDIGNAYHSSVNGELLAGAFHIEGMDIGGIDDFFDFESWF